MLMNQSGASVQRDLKRWSAHLLLQQAARHAQRGKLEDAARIVARSVALDPGVAEAHLIRGKILFWQGQFDAAELAFGDAVRLGLPIDRCARCLAALAEEQRRQRAWAMLMRDAAQARDLLIAHSLRLGRAILDECTLARGAQVILVISIIALLWNRS